MRRAGAIAVMAFLIVGRAFGQFGPDSATAALPGGTVERVKVASKALANNLLGESASPQVSVYLPPSYSMEPTRRYPVVYLLHGFNTTDLLFFGPRGIHLDHIANQVFERGAAREMILVMPNCMNAFGGCMYADSATTGNWEAFIADEMVAYIDRNYRTIPRREARGLGGHSMGGYGTLRIGMKRPTVFAALYAMSACCLDEGIGPWMAADAASAERLTSLDPVRDLPPPTRRLLAKAAAWSPNPQRPPLYLDLPTSNGTVVPDVAAKWAAGSPLSTFDRYVTNLRKYAAMGIDIGRQDPLMTSNQTLVQRLRQSGIAHAFETYDGGHNTHIDQRLEAHLLPFFSKYLSFEAAQRDYVR